MSSRQKLIQNQFKKQSIEYADKIRIYLVGGKTFLIIREDPNKLAMRTVYDFISVILGILKKADIFIETDNDSNVGLQKFKKALEKKLSTDATVHKIDFLDQEPCINIQIKGNYRNQINNQNDNKVTKIFLDHVKQIKKKTYGEEIATFYNDNKDKLFGCFLIEWVKISNDKIRRKIYKWFETKWKESRRNVDDEIFFYSNKINTNTVFLENIGLRFIEISNYFKAVYLVSKAFNKADTNNIIFYTTADVAENLCELLETMQDRKFRLTEGLIALLVAILTFSVVKFAYK